MSNDTHSLPWPFHLNIPACTTHRKKNNHEFLWTDSHRCCWQRHHQLNSIKLHQTKWRKTKKLENHFNRYYYGLLMHRMQLLMIQLTAKVLFDWKIRSTDNECVVCMCVLHCWLLTVFTVQFSMFWFTDFMYLLIFLFLASVVVVQSHTCLFSQQ